MDTIKLTVEEREILAQYWDQRHDAYLKDAAEAKLKAQHYRAAVRDNVLEGVLDRIIKGAAAAESTKSVTPAAESRTSDTFKGRVRTLFDSGEIISSAIVYDMDKDFFSQQKEREEAVRAISASMNEIATTKSFIKMNLQGENGESLPGYYYAHPDYLMGDSILPQYLEKLAQRGIKAKAVFKTAPAKNNAVV